MARNGRSKEIRRGKPTRIQEKNEALILRAAEETFALYGYRGAVIERIAEKAGISKPNLLYYFRSKKSLYQRVLEDTAEMWLVPLERFDAHGEPADAFENYIRIKVEYSRTRPFASKLWANELISGAPNIAPYLQSRLKSLIEEKSAAVENWIAQGKMDPIDPRHLFFLIWASTQTYADFGVQAAAVLGKSRLTKADFETGAETIIAVVLKGAGIERRG